jgi:hypothetical protein
MNRKQIALLIAVAGIIFFGTEQSLGQEWVMPYQEQIGWGKIWDGSSIKSVKNLHRYYMEKLAKQELYEYDPHIYTKERLGKVVPKPTPAKPSPAASARTTPYSRTRPTPPPPAQPKNLPPKKINKEFYVWTIYCQGLERDFHKQMIKPDMLCKHCKGKGKFECKICEGLGKWTENYKDFDTAIRKLELEIKRVQRENQRYIQRQILMDSALSASRKRSEVRKIHDEEDTFIRKTKSKIEEIKKAKANPTLYKTIADTIPEKRKIVKCPICRGHCYICCPKCILIEKPTYTDLYVAKDGKNKSHKSEYLHRWRFTKAVKLPK